MRAGGGAWHRRWAAYVAAAGSFPATPTRVLVALTGTWRAGRRCVFQQFGVGHTSALGLVRSPVAISVFALVAVWGVPRLLHVGQILCRMVHNNAYSQDSQEFGASAGAY
jgi:hypothetical protein